MYNKKTLIGSSFERALVYFASSLHFIFLIVELNSKKFYLTPKINPQCIDDSDLGYGVNVE